MEAADGPSDGRLGGTEGQSPQRQRKNENHSQKIPLALLMLRIIPSGFLTLRFVTFAYALAGIAAFAVIISVTKDKDHEDIINFNGLGKTNP